MNVGIGHLHFPLHHRRSFACYRERRSRSWKPPLRLAIRVTLIALLASLPAWIIGFYFANYASL